MDRAQPEVNPHVYKWEVDNNRRNHRHNLRNVKPGIDNKPPESTKYPRNQGNVIQKERGK